MSVKTDQEIAQSIKALNLPVLPTVAGNYLPYIRTGNLLYVSGQICKVGDEVKFTGKLGSQHTTDEGKEAAKICCTNLIAQLNEALGGDFSRLKKIVKITVFVNSEPDYTAQPAVANGASDLLVEIFGEKGKHARCAVGCAALPADTSVEIDGIFEIE